MIAIEGEMREMLNSALADSMVCLVGTASKDGQPQISMKGSVSVYDDETLAYWERSLRSALENVSENPKVVIFYRNPEKRINWRFQGIATAYESGEIREKVKGQTPQPELDRDPDDKGVAILVKVDRITDLGGTVLQQKD